MAHAKTLLSGTDAQLARAAKKLADRTMGAGMIDPDPKAGRELIALVKAAQAAGDDRVIQTLATKELRDIILFAAEKGELPFVQALLKAGVPTDFAMMGMRAINVAVKHEKIDVIEALVAAGDDPSYAGFLGKAVVLHAAADGKLESVRTLAQLGADVNARDHFGNTALLLVSTKANAEIIRLLVEKGADINEANDQGITPLIAAADAGNLAAINELIRLGATVNTQARWRSLEDYDKQGRGEQYADKSLRNSYLKRQHSLRTALMSAAANDHADVVEALLRAGADASLKSVEDRTAADYAEKNGHATVLRVLRGGSAGGKPAIGPRDLLDAAASGNVKRAGELVAAGVDVNAKIAVRYEGNHEDGFTPVGGKPALVIAAECGDLAMVRQLLQLGADVNARGDATVFDNGQSPLHAAAEHGHLEVVRALLKAGANPNAKEIGRKDIPGRTALQIAAEHKRKAVAAELLKLKTKPSKAPRKRPLGKPTGLHEAVENADEKLTRALLDAGADIHKLARSWSPLMFAAFMGHHQLAALLLDRGADVNQTNRLGQTALTVAIHGATMAPNIRPHQRPRRDYAKTLRLLLKRGADANVDTWLDMTPLDMATQNGLKPLATLLHRAGARRSATGAAKR